MHGSLLRLQAFSHEHQQSLVNLKVSKPKSREVLIGFSKQRFENEIYREVVILNKEQTKGLTTIYVGLYR